MVGAPNPASQLEQRPEFRAIGALVLERWFPRIHADPTPPLDKLSGGMIFDEQNEDGEVWFVESARC